MINVTEKLVREKYEAHGFKVLHKGAPDFFCYQLDEKGKMENITFIEVKQNHSDLTLEQKLWREALIIAYNYRIETPDGIREKNLDLSIRCSCTAKTLKGVSYHPSLKAMYQRKGAKGPWTKIGLRCPKCGCFYDLDGKNPTIVEGE